MDSDDMEIDDCIEKFTFSVYARAAMEIAPDTTQFDDLPCYDKQLFCAHVRRSRYLSYTSDDCETLIDFVTSGPGEFRSKRASKYLSEDEWIEDCCESKMVFIVNLSEEVDVETYLEARGYSHNWVESGNIKFGEWGDF